MSGPGKSATVPEDPGEEGTVPAMRRTDGFAGITAPKQGQPAVLFPVSGIFPGTPPKKRKSPPAVVSIPKSAQKRKSPPST